MGAYYSQSDLEQAFRANGGQPCSWPSERRGDAAGRDGRRAGDMGERKGTVRGAGFKESMCLGIGDNGVKGRKREGSVRHEGSGRRGTVGDREKGDLPEVREEGAKSGI